METIYRYTIVIFFVATLSKCNSQTPDKDKITVVSKNFEDSLVKDIPEFFQGKIWKEYFSGVQSLLGIKSIENGFSEWQIRLWVGHGHRENDSSQLIIFKKEDNKISGTLYTYIHAYNSTWDTTTMISGRFNSLKPKSGWKDFADNIMMLGIFELPDYTKLKGYFLATDSYGVTVEVATKNKYRVYDYPDYEGYIDKIEEPRKMFKIMSLIEKEFSIKVIY